MSRARRVPVARLAAGRWELPPQAARYVARVLRAAPGDPLLLFDGAARLEAQATIVACTLDTVVVDVEAPRPGEVLPARAVTLLQALGKGDKVDAVVRDATELGATRIVPVVTERTIVKLGERAGAREERWRRIATEAARQSGRSDVPDVGAVLPLGAALRDAAEGVRLALTPGAPAPLARLVLDAPPGASVALLIGPEGGLSDAELEAAAAHGFSAVRLGGHVLRTETAAAAALGALAALDDSASDSAAPVADAPPSLN